MSELTIQWQSDAGEKKAVKIPNTKGAALTSNKLGVDSSVTYPVAVAVDDGWVISVPQDGSAGEIKRGDEKLSLGDVAKSATWSGKGEGEGQLAVLRFKIGTDIGAAKIKIPGGTLLMSAPTKGAAPDKAAPAPAKPAPPTSNAGGAGKPPAAPPKSPASGPAPPPVEVMTDADRSRTFRIIMVIVLLLDIAFMWYLGSVEVPDEAYADPTELPERFAQLIVPDQEPEPEEESGGGGDDIPEEVEEVPEETGEEDGGGDEPAEASAPRSAEEKREAVRSKGILAVFASKRSGGALADVLGDGGVAAGLDQALNDVGGVVVAKRGMDISTQRGGGGAKSADIGNLKAGSGRGMGLGDKAKKQVKAGVKTASFTSQGSLSADAIRAVVEKNIRGVKFCYEKQLANNPELQGKVIVKFTIGLDGGVSKYEIESSTMNNNDVEGCILKRVRRWRFPKPEKDAVTVSYPFIFTATG